MQESRMNIIEELSCHGNLIKLREIFNSGYSQLEIDVALEGAIAYSHIETAEYLLSLGADFSNYNYQSVYYAAYHVESEGLKFAISKGVDINVNNGMILHTCIITAFNAKNTEMLKWVLDNGADTKLLSKEIIDAFGNAEIRELLEKYS